MTKFNVSKHVVTIAGRQIRFEQEVTKVLDADDRVVVMLDAGDFENNDPLAGRNVFAFDDNAGMLWRIEDSGCTMEGPSGSDIPVGFTGMSIRQGGRLQVFHPISCLFDVDPETGKLSNMRDLGKA